jgi:hypothetical protein
VLSFQFPETADEVQSYSAQYGWALGIKNAQNLMKDSCYRDMHLVVRNIQPRGRWWKDRLGQLIRVFYRSEPPQPRPVAKPDRIYLQTFTPTVIYEVGYNGPLVRDYKHASNASLKAFEEKRANLDWNEVFI